MEDPTVADELAQHVFLANSDAEVFGDVIADPTQTFVANTIEEIAEVFGDYELIQSLGCESVMNVPINIRGQVVGTLNCLNVAGHFTPERVVASEALKVPGALAFLMAQQAEE